MINKFQIKAIFLFGYLLWAAVLLYPALGSYFSQDDFHHLRTIMDKNFSDIPLFFVTWQEGQTFYRPLSREIFNLFMYKTFGLNPLPFHIVNLLQILTIAALSFILIKRITASIAAAAFGVILYSVNAVHGVELYYLASVQVLFAAIFLLLSLLSFLTFLEKPKLKNYLLTALFFVLALLSHGMAVMFPGVLALLIIWKKCSARILLQKKTFFIFVPFIIINLIFISFSSLFSLPTQQVYQPVISLKAALNTFFWYTLWTFGLPEMLVDFVGSGFRVNPNLMRWYGNYLNVVLPLLVLFTLSLIGIFYNFRNKLRQSSQLFLFIAAFAVSLFPFLIFPQHKFVSYLSFAVVWFSAAVGCLLSRVWGEGIFRKIWVVGVIGCFAIVSWQTTALNARIHWAAKRAAAAKFLLEDIKTNYPRVEKGATFYFKNDADYPDIAKDWGTSSKQAFYILSGADGLKLLYKDSSIQVYYEDVSKLPIDVRKSEVIYYTARFPY